PHREAVHPLARRGSERPAAGHQPPSSLRKCLVLATVAPGCETGPLVTAIPARDQHNILPGVACSCRTGTGRTLPRPVSGWGPGPGRGGAGSGSGSGRARARAAPETRAGRAGSCPCSGQPRVAPGLGPGGPTFSPSRTRRGPDIGPQRGNLGRRPAAGPAAYPPEPTACPATGPVNCPVVPPPFAPLWGGLRGGAAPVWRRDGCVRTAPPDHCAIHTAEAG